MTEETPTAAAPTIEVDGKLFTEKQVGVSAFLAGPLPAGIMMYLNVKRLGDDRQASYTLLGTILFTVLLVGLVMMIPSEWDDNPLTKFTSSIVGAAAYAVYAVFLKEKVDAALQSGAEAASNWSVFGISIGGLILTMALIFSFALSMPPFEGEVMEFGPIKNAVYYDTGTATAEELETIAAELESWGYFDDVEQGSVHFNGGPNRAILTIPIAKDVWNDSLYLNFGYGLHENLSAQLDKQVMVVFEDYKLDGTTITKMFPE